MTNWKHDKCVPKERGQCRQIHFTIDYTTTLSSLTLDGTVAAPHAAPHHFITGTTFCPGCAPSVRVRSTRSFQLRTAFFQRDPPVHPACRHAPSSACERGSPRSSNGWRESLDLACLWERVWQSICCLCRCLPRRLKQYTL